MINFVSGPYQATIDGGNLADALNRIVNTGNPQVLVLASAAATITTADGGSLAPTAEQNAAAVIAAAQTTPIWSDIRKVNDVNVDGTGTELDPWGPV
jgi:hypothetical protein